MALKEKLINHEVHYNPEYESYKNKLSWEYMNLFSLYSLLFCVIGLCYNFIFNDFFDTFKEYMGNQEIVINLFFYSVMASLGQVFIFQFLEKWGPLTLSIVTGVRKILSIALSIIFFGKAVSFLKVVSLLLGTTVISWEVSEKTHKGIQQHHHVTHVHHPPEEVEKINQESGEKEK